MNDKGCNCDARPTSDPRCVIRDKKMIGPAIIKHGGVEMKEFRFTDVRTAAGEIAWEKVPQIRLED